MSEKSIKVEIAGALFSLKVADEDEDAGAGQQPARGPMHQPADIGRELLRLGAGQQHAVVQGMQEALLGDPVLALDQIGMHERNLARWTAKADETQL